MIFRPKVFAAPSGSSEATSTSAGSRPRTESRTAPPTTYAGNGTARSRGKRCIRDSRHDIAESADPLDLDLDLVAPAQGAHSGPRAGQDQIVPPGGRRALGGLRKMIGSDGASLPSSLAWTA